MIVLLLLGCKKDDNPIEPLPNSDFILAENTVQADSNNFKSALITLDSNQVIFSGSNSLSQSLDVGEYLVSDYGEGIFRKILSKQILNNQIIFTTRQAALDEVVIKGKIEWDSEVNLENVEFSFSDENTKVNKTQENISVSFLGIGIGAGRDVNMDVTTSFEPPIVKCIILIDNGVKYIEASIKITNHTNITTTAVRRAFIQGQVTPDWATITFQPGIPIPGIPLIRILPKIKFGLGCNAAVEESMTNEINGTIELTGGIKYENGNWSLIKSITNSFNSGQLTRSSGELTGYLIAPRFGLYIAGAVGPFVDLQFYGKFRQGLENGTPYYGRYAGIKSTAGVEAKILSWSLSYSGVLFNFENELEKVYINNSAPNASFSIAPSTGNTSTNFSFDASHCNDQEDPTTSLMVRWDWEGDGIWDTQYSNSKMSTHIYNYPGTFNPKLQVKDTGGLIDEISLQLIVSNLGNINVTQPTSSTTWTQGQQDVTISWDTGNLGGNVKIELYNGTSLSQTISSSTANDGSYNLYDVLSTQATGTSYRVKVTSTTNTAKYDYSDYFTVSSTGGSSTIDGVVSDATSGNPIASATVKLIKNGSTISTKTTSSTGSYSFTSVVNGTYSVEASKTGYVTDSKPVVTSGNQNYNINFSLSPNSQNIDYRVVLTWGIAPVDLDAHLIKGSYHIYFQSMGAQNSPPYTVLDVDDRSSYGPETITIYNQNSDYCKYFIHNFSGESDIKLSSAIVKVYSGTTLLGTYSVPSSGTGTYWYVFDITTSGSIVTKNIVQSTPPTGASEFNPSIKK